MSLPSDGGIDHTKRQITLIDDSMHAIDVTLWNQSANFVNAREGAIQEESKGPLPKVGDVIAIKGAKISDFGGKSLSVDSLWDASIYTDLSEIQNVKRV
jgi:replication factor A1